MISPIERCPYCFAPDANLKRCCKTCRKHPLLFDRIASAFDYEGLPATLIKQLKYGGQTHLAQGAGGYLAAQFLTLDWPLPDLIIPMPSTPIKKLERGFNQSLLLAEAFATIINRPVVEIIKRKNGDFAQANLNHKERLQLRSTSFEVKSSTPLDNQCILIIDDVMTTGSSLKCCAESLLPLFPKSLYALTFCRAGE